MHRSDGYSLLEAVFVVALTVTVSAAAIPQLLTGLDDYRTGGAARYVAATFQRMRVEAISRSTTVALQFAPAANGYTYTGYVDGNGNGVLAHDVLTGADPLLRPPEQLSAQFSGVDFGALPGLPPIDAGSTAPGADPIRLGRGNSISFTPLGTATSGSVYVLGRGGAQYAVRVFGETGRTRVLKFDPRLRSWRPL
jgi:hypothetical protein